MLDIILMNADSYTADQIEVTAEKHIHLSCYTSSI